MTRNMATADRLLRTVFVAPALIASADGLGFGTAAGIVLIVLAGVMLATAAIGSCPLYTVPRIDIRQLCGSSAKTATPARR